MTRPVVVKVLGKVNTIVFVAATPEVAVNLITCTELTDTASRVMVSEMELNDAALAKVGPTRNTNKEKIRKMDEYFLTLLIINKPQKS
jgi:hypothetical protein